MCTSKIRIENLGGIWRVGISPDGQQIAFVAGGIYTLNLECLSSLRKLPEHTNANSLLFGPKGDYLLVAGGSDDDPVGSQIRVYSTTTFEKTFSWEAHERQVRMVRFSPDKRLLVSTGVDAKVKIWDAQKFGCVAGFFEHTRNVQDAAFTPCGRYVISGGLEGLCWVWRVADQQPVSVFEGHKEEELEKAKRSRVACVGISPDGAMAVSGSYGGTIRVWDSMTGKELSKIQRQGYSGVNHLSFTPDGQNLIAVHTDGQISFINTNSWQEEQVVQAHTKRTLGHSLSSDGSILITGGWDNQIKVCNVSTRTLTQTIILESKKR